MPEFPRKDFRLHVGWRTIKTAVSAMLEAIVVLCIVLFSTPIETYMSYALNRMFDTAIGVIAALLVNYFLPRPRVVSLWEGFKGSFKKDSKV